MSNIVQVVSREIIKPSSPTPKNLRYLELSSIDQVINPPIHSPLILFYVSNGTAVEPNLLKQSLSEVLRLFYPLAGRLKREDDAAWDAPYLYVDCNDEGVKFCEARVNGVLSEFLHRPMTEKPGPLLPRAVPSHIPLAVQLSVFECGGFAIGLMMSHTVADGMSMFMFVKSWAEVSCGNIHKVVPPTFGFSSVFPPRRCLKNGRILEEQQLPSSLPEVQNTAVLAKSFVFDAAKIALLREKISSFADFLPTRVEAVTALIWRCLMRSRGEARLENMSVALHSVDIRKRMEPPLPEYSFGNLVGRAFTTCTHFVGDGSTVGYLEGQLREAIAKMKGCHLKQVLQDDSEMSIWKSFVEEGKCEIDLYMFTSWVRFPIYELDFGWGNPERFTLGQIQLKNGVLLGPMKDGEGGIEAVLFLEVGQMEKVEQDAELLAFASATIDQQGGESGFLPCLDDGHLGSGAGCM